METYVLRKPLNFEGKEITEIELNLDDMSKEDIDSAEQLYRLNGGRNMGLLEMDKRYLTAVISFASGLPIEAFNGMGARNYTHLTLKVQNFLLPGDSELEKTAPTHKPGQTQTLQRQAPKQSKQQS